MGGGRLIDMDKNIMTYYWTNMGLNNRVVARS